MRQPPQFLPEESVRRYCDPTAARHRSTGLTLKERDVPSAPGEYAKGQSSLRRRLIVSPAFIQRREAQLSSAQLSLWIGRGEPFQMSTRGHYPNQGANLAGWAALAEGLD